MKMRRRARPRTGEGRRLHPGPDEIGSDHRAASGQPRQKRHAEVAIVFAKLADLDLKTAKAGDRRQQSGRLRDRLARLPLRPPDLSTLALSRVDETRFRCRAAYDLLELYDKVRWKRRSVMRFWRAPGRGAGGGPARSLVAVKRMPGLRSAI